MKISSALRLCLPCFFAAGLAISNTNAQAPDSWPNKQVRIVVPYVAGAMGDVVARRLSDGLRNELGQAVLVENRPGAGGNIGTQHVEQSAADGYTILLAATNNFTINQFLYKDLGFDPIKRLDAITVLVDVPSVIFVPASIPVNSFREFVNYAKANQGKINYGSPGSGTTPHISAESINKSFGLGMTHIPYKGASQAVAALLAGDIQFYLAGAGLGAPYVKSGKLKAIAVSSKSRLDVFPDIPTFNEAGLGAINASNWWGVAVPAGTPRAIGEKIRNALCKVMSEPSSKAAMTQMGNVPVCNSTMDAQKQFAEEALSWQRNLPGLNIKVD
jgi:tripartite-type tricarboxylate transporter receptor subunit TctC